MSENTKIEWCDATVNHWAGCTAVSPACDNCYAKRMAGRLWGTQWGPGLPRHQFAGADKTLRALDRKAQRQGRPLRVFHNSLSDFFDKDVPVQWRISAMRSIVETPNLIHILLTKRIGNAAEMLDVAFRAVHGQREKWADNVPSNVWIGATIADQPEADRDISKLLAVPAAKRILSMEPLLGPVSFEGLFANPRNLADGTNALEELDWVIVGGESGPGARPMHPEWARSLRDQCEAAGVPFLFKQWGEWRPMETHEVPLRGGGFHLVSVDDRRTTAGYHLPHQIESMITDPVYAWQCPVVKVGKKAAGRLLDGRTWDGVPTS